MRTRKPSTTYNNSSSTYKPSTTYSNSSSIYNRRKNSAIYPFSDISIHHTFRAKGANVDYLFFINFNKYKRATYNSRYVITKIYNNIVNDIEVFKDKCNSINDIFNLIRYLGVSEIIRESGLLHKRAKTNSFNYCIGLCDKFQPDINIDIKSQLEVFKNIADGLSEKAVSNQDIADINNNICNYIILWIHAFRFLKAREQCLSSNKDSVVFSHRYRGWSQPRKKLDDNFGLEFKTNFGYGKSSYFYLVIFYKDIQICNFTDWIDYKLAEISEMHRYTRKYEHEYSEKFIDNNLWSHAMREASEICNCYLGNENKFIELYIVDSLEYMVSNLEAIIDINDSESYKNYRSFEYTFSSNAINEDQENKVKLMSVKGSMISGALQLLGEIIKLKNIMNIDDFVVRIESLNRRILPILEESFDYNKKLKVVIETKIQDSMNNADIGLPCNLQSKLHGNEELRGDLENINKLLGNINLYKNTVNNYFNNL